jgi:hypothetical protein
MVERQTVLIHRLGVSSDAPVTEVSRVFYDAMDLPRHVGEVVETGNEEANHE